MRKLLHGCTGLALGLCVASWSTIGESAIWPSAVRKAERELSSSDAAVRQAAARSLVDMPHAAARRLLFRVLADPDPAVASTALDSLLRLETPKVSEHVIDWLSGSDRKLRLAAARALTVAPAPSATPALARALSDSDAEVRAAAAVALGSSDSSDAVLPLLGHLDDSVPEVREAVAGALGGLGDARAVLPLIGKIEDARPSVRSAAARALGTLGGARAESALLLALRDPDRNVVITVVRALGQLAERSAVPHLSALLEAEPDAELRRALLGALGAIGGPEAARALLREVASDEPGRERAAVLIAMKPNMAAFAPALRACLETATDSGQAEGCALALAQSQDAAASSVVRTALDRGRVSARVGLDVLAALGDERSLSACLERLTARDAETRSAAIACGEALLTARRADGRAVEPIVRALSARGVARTDRLRLVSLLGRTGSARALPTLLPLLQAKDDVELGQRVVEALGHIPDPAIDRVLLDALDSDEQRLAHAAALSIRRAERPELLPALLTRLEKGGGSLRSLVSVALFGPLRKSEDDTLVAAAARLVRSARGAERDALLEALAASGRAPAWQALRELTRSQDAADRAKAAELMARPGAPAQSLMPLLGDSDESVRANAAWALGFASGGESALLKALEDRSSAVVGNAAVALGRRAHGQRALCSLLGDARASVREQALRGLQLARVHCPGESVARLLARDPRARVRRAAAELMLLQAGDKAIARRLARCYEQDPDAGVAETCGGSIARPMAREADPITIFVIPAGASAPVPSAPFALLLADGSLRRGSADRRGALHEARAARGEVELAPYAGGD